MAITNTDPCTGGVREPCCPGLSIQNVGGVDVCGPTDPLPADPAPPASNLTLCTPGKYPITYGH